MEAMAMEGSCQLEGLKMSRANEPLVVTDKMRCQIAAAVAEIDLQQIAYLRRLTPAERVQRAASMIDAAERVGAYRLRQRQPERR